jgi:glycosyltransferase involved in cell wall biosynthesis
LLAKLEKIQPDVVHLHNMHGYYVNVEMLFEWLAAHEDVQVKWTLHDCWAFTGHCVHFQYVGCDQWRDGSECAMRCPQLNSYPKTMCASSSGWGYQRKRACFTQLPRSRMTLVTPSHWLEGLVKESFLAKYPVEVRHNTIDRSVFKPTPSDFRRRYGIGNRFMILGVACPWTERKGLGDFVRLANELDSERYVIVIVGLCKRQIREMPNGIIGIERTDSPQELAAIYTAANVFFNPTREDNFPTVNLEAEACRTPVIAYNTGGCRESIQLPQSSCI